jgi:hypothetical protein
VLDNSCHSLDETDRDKIESLMVRHGLSDLPLPMAPCKSEPKMKEFPWEGPNFKANLRKFQRVGNGRVNNGKEIPKDRIKISKEFSMGYLLIKESKQNFHWLDQKTVKEFPWDELRC